MIVNEEPMANLVSRRSVLRGVTGLGVAAVATKLLSGCGSGTDTAAPEAPPETATVRIPRTPLTSVAAQAVASDFLKEEGFTDVRYVDIGRPEDLFSKFAAGEFDFSLLPAPMVVSRVDAGDPFVALGGVNAGCFQVFGSDSVMSLSDFKGKIVTTSGPGLPDDVFLAVTLANVGVDVRSDVKLITHSHDEAVAALTAGEVDGMTALPPFSNRLRVNHIGHVVLDSNVDRPWSQYFFSMPTVHREYMTRHPTATKRALRALLKAADVVAKDPVRSAQAMKDLGFVPDALVAATIAELRLIPYDVWRRYDPADTLRFYALRLKEAGLIRSTPDEIVKRGADFRVFQELKKELVTQ